MIRKAESKDLPILAELASDCELDNVQSLHFYLNVGFEEANRIICFTKKI